MTGWRIHVIPVLLVLLTVFCILVLGYDEVLRIAPDDVIKSILAFIVGVLSNQLGNSNGQASTIQAYQNGARHASPPTS